jgi:ubiquinone biosynthesis protein
VNWYQFGRLVHSLYRRGGPLPDLDWIESLGLLAVKLCQVHALRIDFLEQEKCEHLARLYRRNTPLRADDFMVLLRDSGVEGLRARFRTIDDDPLATASVGQVHRAQLLDGDEVVIKAVKADLRQRFVSDVASLKRLFRFATWVYPQLRRVGDPIGILEDVEAYTLAELNLRNEIEGQDTLRQIRDEHTDRFDLSNLKFPAAYPSLSNERVLVTEYISGPSIDELLESRELRYEQLLELFRLHGFYMFCVGTFHGDLHPGNVLLQGEDFYFIDTGFIGRVDPRTRDGLFNFFGALAHYDYRACVKHLNAMSARELEGAALESFERGFLALYSDFRDATVSQVSLTARMMQTIKLGVRSGLTFDKGIFAIIRSLMYLDGMVLRCRPDAVLMRDMRPLLEEFLAARDVVVDDSRRGAA